MPNGTPQRQERNCRTPSTPETAPKHALYPRKLSCRVEARGGVGNGADSWHVRWGVIARYAVFAMDVLGVSSLSASADVLCEMYR